jgi:predicted DNA-binding protein (MmcQ/YjbR family)
VAKASTVLPKMREICLALPDTKETLTWGEPHFRVGEKIFAGLTIGFKLEMDHADGLVQDARFHRAPYVGHKGWVSMDAVAIRSWKEVKPLVLESYRLIAPRKSFAKLDTGSVRKGARKA